LVDEQITAGRKLIEQLTRGGFPITIAFWVKFKYAEIDPRWLYIVTDKTRKDQLKESYMAVHAAIQTTPPPWRFWIDFSDLKVVDKDDSLASVVIALVNAHSGRNRYRDRTIGGQVIEELFVYTPEIIQDTETSSMTGIHEKVGEVLQSLQAGNTEDVKQGLEQLYLMSGGTQNTDLKTN
jgi:hypothetical protein